MLFPTTPRSSAVVKLCSKNIFQVHIKCVVVRLKFRMCKLDYVAVDEDFVSYIRVAHGSASGPSLGNEYGKPLLLPNTYIHFYTT